MEECEMVEVLQEFFPEYDYDWEYDYRNRQWIIIAKAGESND